MWWLNCILHCDVMLGWAIHLFGGITILITPVTKGGVQDFFKLSDAAAVKCMCMFMKQYVCVCVCVCL